MQSLISAQIQATTQHDTQLEYIMCKGTWLLAQRNLRVMATRGELVSTHMPKKARVENWLHECQLLVSVTLPLGSTVGFVKCFHLMWVYQVIIMLQKVSTTKI